WIHPLERRSDGRIIGGGKREGLLREPPFGLERELSLVGRDFGGNAGIVIGRGDDSDVTKVLGGGADHGGPADVDVLNQFVEFNARLSGGLLEGVEVHDDHIDGLDLMFGDCASMGGISADMKDAAVNLRVQRLYAAVEHFR